MKQVLISLTFFLMLISAACQDQHQITPDSTLHEKLFKIVKNEHYKAYIGKSKEIRLNIARGSIDLLSLNSVIMQYSSFCEIPSKEVEKIKGGANYVELNCELTKLSETLKKEVPEYFQLNKEEIGLLVDIRNHLEKNNWHNEVMNSIKNHDKN